MTQERKKLKIVHTEASLGWGGQEIRVMVELREMAKRGHRTVLVAPPDSDIFRRGLDLGIETLPLSMRRRDFGHNLRWLSHFLKSERIDVVNTHSSRDSWLAGFAASRAKVPLVVKTRHISAPVSKGWLTRLAYQKLHHYIITTSAEIKDDLIRNNGFNPDHISSIPTGVDLKRFDVSRKPIGLRRELGLSANTRLVGMVSVLRSWKGHPDFLRAARLTREKMPETYFIIVGEGPRRAQIEEEMLAMGLEDHVFLTGHRDEIPQILRDLDVFVLPSYANEGVPQALLQALAMERPVVATSIGGIPEVITHGKHGFLCKPQNPESLTACILEALMDPERAKEMARAGRQKVEERYSLEEMVRQLEKVYYQMLPA